MRISNFGLKNLTITIKMAMNCEAVVSTHYDFCFSSVFQKNRKEGKGWDSFSIFLADIQGRHNGPKNDWRPSGCGQNN